MPPIEMTMSPVDDKICIEIPKKYRSYSFAVTLVPVRKDLADRRRRVRRSVQKSAFELMHCPILDDGEELDISRDHQGVSKHGDTEKGRLLSRWLKTAVLGRYVGRIIAVERRVATEWGRICGEAERVGNRRPQVDSLIAATAVAHKMTLVTRNVRDMEGTGARLLNPFAADKTAGKTI